jgi:hypothetical protein
MAKKHAPPKSSKRKPAAPSVKKAAPEVQRRAKIENETPPAASVASDKGTPSASKSSSSMHPAPTGATRTPRAPVAVEAALSFLRDTKGSLSWSLRDLSRTLNISREEAERIVPLLQIQGYVQQHKPGEWITTPSGETVSGAKPPRFDRETVEAALTSLEGRIQSTNKDRAAKFQITRAVAFGDFLARDHARVQPADVGIQLVRRDRAHKPDEIAAAHSAVEAREENLFLRQLRGRSALLNLKTYSEWMGARTHQKLF